jgi:UDP-2,3-diacylglucosamine pyrophosphatase LpxH
VKRVIISDLHIGSKYSRQQELALFLSDLECHELILAGDIIDFIKMPSFNEQSAALFNLMDLFSGRIIYIVGNHDISFKNMIGCEVFGVKFVDKYEFESGEKRFIVEHGDKYEKGLIHRPCLINIISIFQDYLERYFDINLSYWYRRLFANKRRLRGIWDIVRWNENADVFITGHTHTPEALIWVDQDENIKTYVNCGDWVEHTTYITIEEGTTRLKRWLSKK